MIGKIIKEVKSPFTNELIEKLIKEYLKCNCDDELFYNEINKLGDLENKTDDYVSKLINKIHSQGIDWETRWSEEKENGSKLLYRDNRSWEVIYSEEDPIKDQRKKGELIYRIYLNLKGKEKVSFIENYIKKCQEDNVPFQFKFSKKEDRNDQIIILSRSENFEKNVLIVEELTKGLQLGELPMLVGNYKNGIGIAEESYNRLHSPTEMKLILVRSSIKKYLCDHKDEIYKQLSDEEKKIIDSYILDFMYAYKFEKKDIEKLGADYEDEKGYYQRKSSIDCYKEHIENDRDVYLYGTNLQELDGPIKQIYSSNPEQFVNEVTENYKMIGTEVWGFSKDFVFSNETNETYKDFVNELKEYLDESCKRTYKDYSEMSLGLKLTPMPYEEYLERDFNQRINCGGYALELDACVFKHNISFEKAVSSLLEQVSFIRLLGNTKLQDDEYIVKYRTGDDFGHHFIKIKDGVATEKDAASEVRAFEDWPENLQNVPEAVFAVKKDHDFQLGYKNINLDNGKDFDDMVNEAYNNKQNNFEYHCQNYSFKKDENNIYIYSEINNELTRVGELLIEEGECIYVIEEGYEDYISNTKTNYIVGKKENKKENDEYEKE